MLKRQVLLIAILIGSMLLLQGCVVAAVGLGAAGTVAYVRGDLESMEWEQRLLRMMHRIRR